MSKTKKNKNNYYVNNKDFFMEIVEWLKLRKKDPNLPLTDSLGKMIYNIVHRYSYRPNFINYSYKDKFISEGLYTCIRYADRFNPQKSQNPFAYFTRIAWSSFVKCIIEEKKITKTKKKLVDEYRLNNTYLDKIKDNEFNDLTCFDIREEFAPITITNKKGKSKTFKTELRYNHYVEKKMDSNK